MREASGRDAGGALAGSRSGGAEKGTMGSTTPTLDQRRACVLRGRPHQ